MVYCSVTGEQSQLLVPFDAIIDIMIDKNWATCSFLKDYHENNYVSAHERKCHWEKLLGTSPLKKACDYESCEVLTPGNVFIMISVRPGFVFNE